MGYKEKSEKEESYKEKNEMEEEHLWEEWELGGEIQCQHAELIIFHCPW